MNRRGFLLAMRLMGLGWYIGLCIVFGTGGGIWLDRRLGTLPLFTLLGVGLGSVVAFYGLYRMVLPFMSGDSDANERN